MTQRPLKKLVDDYNKETPKADIAAAQHIIQRVQRSQRSLRAAIHKYITREIQKDG